MREIDSEFHLLIAADRLWFAEPRSGPRLCESQQASRASLLDNAHSYRSKTNWCDVLNWPGLTDTYNRTQWHAFPSLKADRGPWKRF
jgi:hypothetical protein